MENTVTLMGMLPLIVMTLVMFFLNRWVGKKVGVWTPGVIVCDLIKTNPPAVAGPTVTHELPLYC